jgi:ornithine cyclodeaminase/alanine dehydrogenase-like protein (mu-crystallin family)
MTQEMDASIYMGADQIVVSGRAQEGRDTKSARAGGSAIRDLLADGRLSADRLVNLAQVVRGEVVPRNGPAEVLVYRESRGPAGDVALASWIVDRAREAKLGTEFRF